MHFYCFFPAPSQVTHSELLGMKRIKEEEEEEVAVVVVVWWWWWWWWWWCVCLCVCVCTFTFLCPLNFSKYSKSIRLYLAL